MSKMTKPTVDVVRFHESDVIVASGIMRVTDLGNGGLGDGRFAFGPTASYTTSDIAGNTPYFLSEFNKYFKTNFNSTEDISVDGYSISTLVSDDMDSEREGLYTYHNGTYRWNGTMFDRQGQ